MTRQGTRVAWLLASGVGAVVGACSGSAPPAPIAATAPPAATVPPTTPAEPAWRTLLGVRSETAIASVAPGFVRANFGGGGDLEESADGVRLAAGSPLTGIVWPAGEPTVERPPPFDYELEVEAARLAGTDFFCALTFPVGTESLTLVLGGWGGSTCGFSCLDGRDAASNPTTRYRRFDKGRFVTARVRVTAERVEAFVDGEPLCSTPLPEITLSLRPEVEPCRPLGVASYATTAQIRAVRWRPLRRE